MPIAKSYTQKEVAKKSGLPPRKVAYYTDAVGIRPDIKDAKVRGSNRKYSYENVIEFLIVKELAAMGLSLAIISDVMLYLFYCKERANSWLKDRVEGRKSKEIMYCFIHDSFDERRRTVDFVHMARGAGAQYKSDGTPWTLQEYMQEDQGVKMVIVLNISQIVERVAEASTP